MTHIWVVEASWTDYSNEHTRSPWRPTVGVGLTREDGLRKLQDWRNRNPGDHFRLVKYITTLGLTK